MELTPEAIYAMAPFARTLGIGFPALAPDAVHAELPTAVARPVRVGRTLVNVEIDVHDEGDRHCARTGQVLLSRS